MQPFKFENIWTKRKDFGNLVRQSWRNSFPGSHMFNLVKKIAKLKTMAKNWNRTTFGNTFKQLEEIEGKLLELQSGNQLTSNNSQDLTQPNLLRKGIIS